MSEMSEDNNWKKKRVRKEKKEDIVKRKKKRGEEHVNHVGKLIPQKTVGPDCRCKRFKCFDVVDEDSRKRILSEFLNIENKDLQDSHLCGLITVQTVKQRRSRKTLEDDEIEIKNLHSAAFYYKIRLKDENSNISTDVAVCQSAFLSFHGITSGRLRRLRESLATSSQVPRDRRGKHSNRPAAIPSEVRRIIANHITSFKPRQSHYSIRKNPNRQYLPETLTIKAMYLMFLNEYRLNIHYKTYWSAFKEYNIRFGMPRSDTCTVCDTLTKKIAYCESPELKIQYENEKKLHLLKANKFYELKKEWKIKSRASETNFTVFSFDFMQNLPLPHLQTNTVFFCRQLWYYIFGIHNFSDDDAVLYAYHEGMANKGQNDVTSMLFHYIHNTSSDLKDNLVLFSDGCSGQNKNYVMVHFLYMLVHSLKIFKTIRYIFPIRGHSFLPNDQDFAIVEKRKRKEIVETPQDWDVIMKTCREKPTPFKVQNISSEQFYNIKSATDPYFLKTPKPPIKLKTVRMYKIESGSPLLYVKDHYNGAWRTCIIRNKKRLPEELNLSPLYTQKKTINKAKMDDIKKLYPYIKPESRLFYDSLQVDGNDHVHNEADVDYSDNSSGDEDL